MTCVTITFAEFQNVGPAVCCACHRASSLDTSLDHNRLLDLPWALALRAQGGPTGSFKSIFLDSPLNFEQTYDMLTNKSKHFLSVIHQEPSIFKAQDVLVQMEGGHESLTMAELSITDHGFCDECADTVQEIAPWCSLDEAKSMCTESETFKSKICEATEFRTGREPATWLTDDQVRNSKNHHVRLSGIWEGWDTPESFAKDNQGVFPEEICVPPVTEPNLFGIGTTQVYYLPKRGPCYERRQEVDIHLSHHSACLGRQLYSTQGADTLEALANKTRSEHTELRTLLSLRTRAEIDKDIEAIASQRRPQPNLTLGLKSPPAPRPPPRVAPAAFATTGYVPVATGVVKSAPPLFPPVPVFPQNPDDIFRKKGGSSSSASNPVAAAPALAAAGPPSTPPRTVASRLSHAANSPGAANSPVISSPPHAKARSSPPSKEAGAPTNVVNLGDLRGKPVTALDKPTPVALKRPDDAMSVRSATSATKSGKSLESRFPNLQKHERPMAAYPWTLGLDGHNIKDAKTQVRRAMSNTESTNPETHQKLVNHEAYLVTSAEINVWRMIETEIDVIHAYINKLKDALPDGELPSRNYIHLAVR